MTIFQAIILGVLQGVAEFLPISSSGHLKIVQSLFKLKDIPLIFDVTLHIATLLAVILYFRKRLFRLIIAFLGIFRIKIPRKDEKNPMNEQIEDCLTGNDTLCRKTILAIIIATFITGIIGVFTSKIIPDLPIKFICLGFLLTAVLLILSSVVEKNTQTNNQGISCKQAIFIGFMQGIGTLPGVSRSGSTISAAIFSRLPRTTAGEFSFIISIPAILGAFILEAKDLKDLSFSLAPLLASCIAAFVSGYFALHFLMNLIKKGKIYYFAIYLVAISLLSFRL